MAKRKVHSYWLSFPDTGARSYLKATKTPLASADFADEPRRLAFLPRPSQLDPCYLGLTRVAVIPFQRPCI